MSGKPVDLLKGLALKSIARMLARRAMTALPLLYALKQPATLLVTKMKATASLPVRIASVAGWEGLLALVAAITALQN